MEIEVFTGSGFGENALLLVEEDRGAALVVDPGAAAPAMAQRLEAGDLAVEAILLTHAHLDHVEGLPAIRSYAPEAPIYLHPADRLLYDHVTEQAKAFSLPMPPELPEPDRTLSHGQVLHLLGLAIHVRHTPGHAPGHVIFHLKDEKVALVGDVVFQGSIGRTDLPGGDYQQLMGAIRNEILTLPRETRLLCGHGPETTVAHEAESNPFVAPHYLGNRA